MKTKSSPSRERYCISRLSTLATSTLTPALKVRSTTLPDMMFFSRVRTKAPPLPGLTCWKSTMFQSWPSIFSVMPFLRSFVVATSACLLRAGARPAADGRLQDEQFPGGSGEALLGGPPPRAGAPHQGVLDPGAALPGEVDPGFDGDGDPVPECARPAVPHDRGLVDLQAHTVAQPVQIGRAHV